MSQLVARPELHAGWADRIERILGAILDERHRQEELGRSGTRPGWQTCADPDMVGGDDRRVAVLTEEVGEVARAVLERFYLESRAAETGARLDPAIEDMRLREELVQVAAVAVAWLEALEVRGIRSTLERSALGRPNIGPLVADLEEMEARARRLVEAVEGIREAALLRDQEDRCRYCGQPAAATHSPDCRVGELERAYGALGSHLELEA